MAGIDETPSANRVHIAFFGLRNAGKSTLVNAFCGQEVAIVSPVAGTTTDPVSKAMEILPLGPCLVTDTAGLDDTGELGRQRVKRTLATLDSTDIAVWVAADGDEAPRREFAAECEKRKVAFVEYRRDEPVGEFRNRLSKLSVAADPGLLDGLVRAGDRVNLVCPIDESAPRGRLILPQVQVIRECLDRHATAVVCQLEDFVDDGNLTVVDSQTFGRVKAKKLTSFSILFARQKGDLEEYRRGLDALAGLRDGDTVLVAEGCTHHRQCNDIGTTKIPKAVEKLSGARPKFVFASGNAFGPLEGVKLVVHCGGCMLTRRTVLSRIAAARARGIPIVNYGLLLQRAAQPNSANQMRNA